MTEAEIWYFILHEIHNTYGTAAIMGNLMAESSLNPRCATGLGKTGILDTGEYILKSDNGQHDFVNDLVAFGLVQWRYWSRKQGLLDYAKSKGVSVGDARTQLEFMLKELRNYKTAWTAVINAVEIRTASDAFMLKYERPAGTGEAAKKKRAELAQKFFDRYMDGNLSEKPVRMVRATSNVNLRAGDSTAYAKAGSIRKGTECEWVATSTTGWHAIRYKTGIYWVSNEFTEVIAE